MDRVFVCGGDMRSVYIKEHLENCGYRVSVFGHGKEEETMRDSKNCNIVVLGLPALKDGMVYMPMSDKKLSFPELLSSLKTGSYLFGGRLSSSDIALAASFGITALDYSEDEIFQTENALYTAEGALCAIIENTDISLCGMRILVLGGGRIAKALCALLANAPCDVDVYARRALQRTFFSMRGNGVWEEIPNFSAYDVVVNTIPVDIFPERIVATATEGTLMLDLSARPGYVPKDICEKYGLNLCYMPGIPLKSAPRSAGIAAANALCRMYRCRGEKNTEGI